MSLKFITGKERTLARTNQLVGFKDSQIPKSGCGVINFQDLGQEEQITDQGFGRNKEKLYGVL